MAAPREPGRKGAATPPGGQRMSFGDFLLMVVPFCAVGWPSAKLYEAVQFAPAGPQFAYAGLTFGLSALAALALAFLLRAPDSWWRRVAGSTLSLLLLVPPMFGCLAFVFALAQVLHNPREGGDVMYGLILWFVWGMALTLPLLRTLKRRNQ